MSKIALSYRRDDTAAITGRIADRLAAQFGKDSIFLDIDNIPIGVDFRERIHTAITHADVLLVVIGPAWLSAMGTKNTRRLDDPADHVRIEIQTALENRVPVIPVLIGETQIPPPDSLPSSLEPLAYLNAAQVRAGKDFHHDLECLIDAINKIKEELLEKDQREEPPQGRVTVKDGSGAIPQIQVSAPKKTASVQPGKTTRFKKRHVAILASISFISLLLVFLACVQLVRDKTPSVSQPESPGEPAEPKVAYPEVFKFLSSTAKLPVGGDEFRTVYTQIATCLDDRLPGRWMIGSGRTADRKAYLLRTNQGELSIVSLAHGEIVAARLLSQEIRSELPQDWRPPLKQTLTISPTQTRIDELTNGELRFDVYLNWHGTLPAEVEDLALVLHAASDDPSVDVGCIADFPQGLPADEIGVTFPLREGAKPIERSAVYVRGFLPKPDPRYYRLSQEVRLDQGYTRSLKAGTAVDDVAETLKEVLGDRSDFAWQMLALEVAISLCSGEPNGWIIGGGSTQDKQPYEIRVANGKWVSQPVRSPSPQLVKASGYTRVSNVDYLNLPEFQILQLYDPSLQLDGQDPKVAKISGTMQAKVLRNQTVRFLTLIYHSPVIGEDEIESFDSFQFFSGRDVPAGTLEVAIQLSTKNELSAGAEFLLIGLVELESGELEFRRISNKVPWPSER